MGEGGKKEKMGDRDLEREIGHGRREIRAGRYRVVRVRERDSNGWAVMLCYPYLAGKCCCR